MEQSLIAYEDAVLTLVDEHGGKVVHRARTDGAEGKPLEIQLFEWASQEAMDTWRNPLNPLASWRFGQLDLARRVSEGRSKRP